VPSENEWERLAWAQGIVSEQAKCTVREALLLIGERALIQHEQPIAIADAVIEGRISFG
jgi:hypothetical protein